MAPTKERYNTVTVGSKREAVDQDMPSAAPAKVARLGNIPFQLKVLNDTAILQVFRLVENVIRKQLACGQDWDHTREPPIRENKPS